MCWIISTDFILTRIPDKTYSEDLMNKTLITAHNGADGTPEGSLEYIRHALSTDADVLEIDIRRLPDGTLIFAHDEPVSTASQVTIESVFQCVYDTPKLINCDLKEPGLETVVYSLAEKCGVEKQLIYSGTVCASHCQETNLNRKVRIALNIERYVPDLYARCLRDPIQTIQAADAISIVCTRYGIECVNSNYHVATEPFIDILEKNGLQLSVWTVNDLSDVRLFLQRGIYNITTRNLRQVLSLAGTVKN